MYNVVCNIVDTGQVQWGRMSNWSFRVNNFIFCASISVPDRPCLPEPPSFLISNSTQVLQWYYYSNMVFSTSCYFSTACIGSVKWSCSEWVPVDMFCRISMLLEFVFLTSHWHVPYECYSLPSREWGVLFFKKSIKKNTRDNLTFLTMLLFLWVAFKNQFLLSLCFVEWATVI